MENALLIGLSQQLALRRNLEIIANNIANINTAGYKSESVLFEEYLLGTPASSENNQELAFVQDTGVIPDLSEGRFEHTGGSLDIALSGDGYFVLDTPEGPRYTRNGHFGLNTEGQVISNDGHPVLDIDGNPITFGPNETELTIANDGTMTTSEGVKGQINVVQFDRPEDLQKIGNSQYTAVEDPVPAESVKVVQGSLEQSNVAPIIEMTKMIEVMRTYQSISDVIKRAEELQRNAVRKLGETNA